MVLHTRGSVGRRQHFYKPLSTDLLRESFFCALVFWEARPHLKMMRPHLNWGHRVLTWGATRPRVGIVKLGVDPPTWQ